MQAYLTIVCFQPRVKRHGIECDERCIGNGTSGFKRPSGTSPPPPRDPRTGVLGYSQGVPPGLPRHRREIPGLASWAIFKASLRDFTATAARSQDWRLGLFSRRPSGTSLTPPRDPRTGVLGYFQGVPPGLPRHRREIPGLASWAILKASLRDFPDTAARSQDWRPGLFSRRPSGTSCRTPSHSTDLKMYKRPRQTGQSVLEVCTF